MKKKVTLQLEEHQLFGKTNQEIRQFIRDELVKAGWDGVSFLENHVNIATMERVYGFETEVKPQVMTIDSCSTRSCDAWQRMEVKDEFELRMKRFGRCVYCRRFKPDLYRLKESLMEVEK